MGTPHFKQYLGEFFKPLKESGNNPNWNYILQYTYENLQFVTDLNVMHACSDFLLNSLIEFECNDEKVLDSILKMCWNVCLFRRKEKLRERFHRKRTSNISVNGHRTAMSDFPINRYETETSNADHRTETSDIPVNTIVSPLNLADQGDYNPELWSWWKVVFVAEFTGLNVMRVLIKYGLYYVPQDATYYDLALATSYLTNFCTEAEQYAFNYMEFVKLPPNLRKLLKQLLYDLHYTHGYLGSTSKESPKIKRGFQRILLIIFTLTAIVFEWKKHPFLDDYIKCIILHLRVVSEPLLTKEEVQNFVSCLFSHKNYEEGIQRIVHAHETIFRVVNSMHYSPRSLKHQCRCFLRKLFTRQPKLLPETLSVLQTPESITNFLLGFY